MSTAPIYAIADADRSRAESAAWASFSSPKDNSEFCASWLAILCSQIDRVTGALLVLGPDQDGGYSAAAVWPDVSRNLQYLGSTAEKALKERRGIVERVFKERRRVVEQVVVERRGASRAKESGQQSAFVGYPIEVSGVLHGAVILDIANPQEQELQRALRFLHWGSAWLIDQFRQQAMEANEICLARLSIASDLVATAVQEYRFDSSALAVANEIAERLQCNRVSLGFEKAGSIEVQTISHTAIFDRKSDLVRLIGAAMDEVLDLDIAIVYPQSGEDELGVIAHAELAQEVKDIAVCSVPLLSDSHAVGVLTLERSAGDAFDPSTIELAKTLGLLLGPIFALKRDNERSTPRRTLDELRQGLGALFGPRHPGVKLIASVLAGLLIFFSLVSGEYRVSAKTVIEGAVQRAAVAPFDGYVAESLARAGDMVKKGQVLCRLDEKDLRLEQTRFESGREQASQKYRQAFAVQDRAAMATIAAQIHQAEAQLSLIEERLSRATLVAPFDGLVVSGDLSQLLGSPVEQGKVLFEIAPLDAYRVILKVDERDIAQLKLGQQGVIALSGIPNETMPFALKQITPVSTGEGGGNYFRVEAQINGPSQRLRPGMEGVGKISVGERKLLWIWTHSLVDWLRLWAWNWLT